MGKTEVTTGKCKKRYTELNTSLKAGGGRRIPPLGFRVDSVLYLGV